MSRREAREHLFRMLFRKEFHELDELDEQILLYFDTINTANEKDLDYLKNKYDQIMIKVSEIDEMIEKASSGWDLNRMGRVELTLMRLAVYEIKFDEDIPTGVAINEAVEIAKIFGEDNSPGFINGILAKVI